MRGGVRLAVIATWLGLAAPAGAATLEEVGFEPAPGGRVATCLRATGAPGGLAELGPRSRRGAAVELLDATAAGVERVRLGRLVDCAAVAAAGGAAVVAAPAAVRSRLRIVATARDPGSGFGVPVAVGDAAVGDLDDAVITEETAHAVAISPAGAAVVAWAQTRFRRVRGRPLPRGARIRILAARRAARGSFGAPQAVTGWRAAGSFGEAAMVAGIDDRGRAVVAWARSIPDRGNVPNLAAVETATAEPGAGFGPVQVLTSDIQDVDGPALAVARDGWLLLAYSGGREVRLLQRRPGESAAAPVATFERAPDEGGEPAVAVRPGGGGVVAWRPRAEDVVAAAVRSADGPFGPPAMLASSTDSAHGFGVPLVVFGGLDLVDGGNRRVRAVVGEDGAAAVSWIARRGATGVLRPMAATGTLDAGLGSAQLLGSPLRSANGVAPLLLADGRVAVAWTDNLSLGRGLGDPAPRGGGRRHLAVAGAPRRTAQPPPRARFPAIGRRRLDADDPLVLPIRCAAACDVRAVVRRGRGVLAAADAQLRPAGVARLRIRPSGAPGARWRGGRTVVRVAWSAPGSPQVATARRIVRIDLRPSRARPRQSSPRRRSTRSTRSRTATAVSALSANSPSTPSR